MTDTKLTAELLDELEDLAKEALKHNARFICVGVHVEPDDVLSLIAAARKLEPARATLIALQGCMVSPANKFQPAYDAWLRITKEPTNGR